MDPEELDRIIAQTRLLLAHLEAAKTTLDTIEGTMLRMESLGMTDAKPAWRNDKYLYLVSPMINGRRNRKYIGSDLSKIHAALEKVDRHQRYLKVQQDYHQITGHLRSIGYTLPNLVSLAAKKPEGW